MRACAVRFTRWRERLRLNRRFLCTAIPRSRVWKLHTYGLGVEKEGLARVAAHVILQWKAAISPHLCLSLFFDGPSRSNVAESGTSTCRPLITTSNAAFLHGASPRFHLNHKNAATSKLSHRVAIPANSLLLATAALTPSYCLQRACVLVFSNSADAFTIRPHFLLSTWISFDFPLLL